MEVERYDDGTIINVYFDSLWIKYRGGRYNVNLCEKNSDRIDEAMESILEAVADKADFSVEDYVDEHADFNSIVFINFSAIVDYYRSSDTIIQLRLFKVN